jgi:hypothetical protein
MFVFWKIRYLDRNDRTLKDRFLTLDTDSLEPVAKAAVDFALKKKFKT